MLRIGGLAMPAPGKLEVKRQRVGSASERALDGTLIADTRAHKRTFTLKWNAMSAEQLSRLAEAIGEDFFEAELLGETIVCCCTARSLGLLWAKDGRCVWKDVEMTITEK